MNKLETMGGANPKEENLKSPGNAKTADRQRGEKVLAILDTIEKETDENKVERILKDEFINIFNGMKERGLPLSVKILEDTNYHTSRDGNAIITEAEEKIGTLKGNIFDAQTFVRIEEEALNEVLNSEAQ